MTVYAPIPAQGSLLKVSISSTLTAVSKRTKIKGPPRKRAKIETTDLDSVAETSIPGIPRGEEVELELNLNPGDTGHAYLETSYEAGNIESWAYVLSQGSSYAFSGYITSFELGEVTTDGLQKAMLKIQITGAVVLTP